MSDDEKKIVSIPNLPNVVKGDGRYLMTMLRDFLVQTAHQVNLANGFSAAEIEASEEGKVIAPKNFVLVFDRLGGVLSWDHIYDFSELEYYELRTDKNLGMQMGLLERTISNTSTVLPITYVGHIYLYAVIKNGDHSTAAEISYTKARPVAPTDIALTKNQEGTLITFLEIPTDCIGADIYVNGEDKFQVTDNIYLYTGDAVIKTLRIAYYDQFGEGGNAYLYCVPPDVTGFMVERNGPYLDFYWDEVLLHNVHYEVHVGITANWNKSINMFETKNNKHRYIYPNVGTYYLLIKAVDEHNNYSENAAYVVISNIADISKNVILSLPQEDTSYSGNKINTYYDTKNRYLKLTREAIRGEYIVSVKLPQKFRARNWYDYKVVGDTESDMSWYDMDFPWDDADMSWNGTADELSWDDMDFPWDGDQAASMTWNGVIGDLSCASVVHEIARYVGDAGAIELFSMDGELDGINGTKSVEQQNCTDYQLGRWHDGIQLDDISRLSYAIDIPSTFGITFSVKVISEMGECIIMTLSNGNDFVILGYDADEKRFYLRGSDGVCIYCAMVPYERDWLTIGISQKNNMRSLYINSYYYESTVSGNIEAGPVGAFTALYCYPKL